MASLARNRRWEVVPFDAGAAQLIEDSCGVSSLAARIMAGRGICDAQQARDFLSPSLDRDWADPLLIPGLDAVVARLQHALEAGEHIAVFGDFDVEAGHIWYTYPNVEDGENNEELYLSVAYNNPIVTPTAAVYWDYRDNDDDGLFYGNLGLAHDFALCDSLTLTPSVSLGMGSDAYLRAYVDDVNKTAFLDQTTGLALTYAVTDWLSVGAQVNYSWIVDRDARRADYMGRDKNQRVWGGVNVAFSF